MYYQSSPDETPTVEIWQEKTVKVHQGGYNLIASSVPSDLVGNFLPKGTPLLLDHEARTAKVVDGSEDNTDVANAFNYAPVKVKGTGVPASPKVSGVYRAYDIQESKLPYPLSAASKAALNQCVFIA